MQLKKHCFLILLAAGFLSACGGGGSASSNNSNSTIISNSSVSSSNASYSAPSQSSSSSSAIAQNPSQCELLNFGAEETISYRLPILYGRCPTENSEVTIKIADKTYTWPLLDGYFKGAVLLERGANEIVFNSGEKKSSVKINLVASQNPQKVQMVYAIAANDDGHFLAAEGEPNDMASAMKRVSTQALMMQSATAEMLYKATGKRQTYTLVEDENGNPIINTLQMPDTRTALYALDGLNIYYRIQDLLNTEAQNTHKYLVIMGFSGYENGRTLAHAALGGGNLGIFGGTHLHSCPENVDEIPARFSDTKLIDTLILPDDSAGRSSYWANCSTGIGASLHELGHTLGMNHTSYGIMMRGFDRFNRLFMINEPGISTPILHADEYDAVWHPDSLAVISFSRWIPQ